MLAAQLFATTPYHCRKQWDLILQTFGLGPDSGLTPGGMRGGSGVFHYRDVAATATEPSYVRIIFARRRLVECACKAA